MEITSRQNLGELDGKLGFDKSKVTCFKCREKGHFKRECPNREANGNQNPFKDDYYKKAIYHKPQPPKNQIEDGSSNSKDKALVVTQEDEGFNWNNFISKKESLALMAEIIEEPEHVPEVADVTLEEAYAIEEYYQSSSEEDRFSSGNSPTILSNPCQDSFAEIW